MGKINVRYVAKAIKGSGWKIWNRKMNKWWGNSFTHYPEELLEELNGSKCPEKIVELSKRK